MDEMVWENGMYADKLISKIKRAGRAGDAVKVQKAEDEYHRFIAEYSTPFGASRDDD